MLNFHGHSQCPYINVARLSVLHYATVAHVVNIPGKSMSTGYITGPDPKMLLPGGGGGGGGALKAEVLNRAAKAARGGGRV